MGKWNHVVLGAIGLLGQAALANQITTIQFTTDVDQSNIRILGDVDLNPTFKEYPENHQLVLMFEGIKLGASAKRALNTSSFVSPVKLVNPYKSTDGNGTTIAIQLRKKATANMNVNGKEVMVTVSHVNQSAGRVVTTQSQATDDLAGVTNADTGQPIDTQTEAQAQPAQQSAPSAPTNSTEAQIDAFLEASKSKKFIGKPIRVVVEDVDIQKVFQMIAEASGFNVIVGGEVVGKVTLTLEEAPWDQVLDLILTQFQLGAERNNNVLRVTTLAKLAQEKQLIAATKKAAEDSAPRVTRVFPISYAKLDDLVTVFQKFASTTGDASKTVVQADSRTNSIIVRDTAENIDRIKKLIEILDTQTPQVMIEAKIVETSEGFSNSLSGSLGVMKHSSNPGSFSVNGGTLSPLDGVPDFTTIGASSSRSATSTPTGLIGMSPTIGFIPGVQRLNALLSISENENKTKIAASPKLVVLNKETANILSAQSIAVTNSTTSGGATTTTTTFIPLNTSLNVTPTVTNDGSVLMDLNISKDSSGNNGTTPSPRNLKTKVIVDSGSTLVIGGIYNDEKTKTEGGFPVLRKIPILGVLFGDQSESDARTEIMIFITPRILNEKESGLSG